MTATEADQGVSVGAWNALVRRARIGRDRKAAALIISSYANANGTGIHCGISRLAVDMECSYRTAQRYLCWLRDVGLIELTRAGNRRRGLSDEYRLILGPNVLEDVEVLDPERYDKLRDGLQEARHTANQASPRVSSKQTGSGVTQGVVQSVPVEGTVDNDQASPKVAPKTGDQASNPGRSGVTQDDAPPSLYTSPKDLPPRKTTAAEARTDLAVARARTAEEPAEVIEIFPGASQEARYRPPLSRWGRAADAIAEASARRRAAEAAHRAAGGEL